MAIQECGNGHLYDTDQYPTCPYCSGTGNRVDFRFKGADEIGKTVGSGVQAVGATVAPSAAARSNISDTGKTVGVFQKKMSFEPVVGWLVCVEGKERGKDYRIYGKNNTIGRDERSDICLKGDDSISRENHAKLAYDRKHNNFHIIPADGANPVYLNDEPVYVPEKLTANDILEIGELKLMFVPFCNDNFKWEQPNKESGAD
ncbi:MAG: FHA domain-containing protein [Eubacterium sp.]|nr:FHA domain-containing protein [Eubacterium sp.]